MVATTYSTAATVLFRLSSRRYSDHAVTGSSNIAKDSSGFDMLLTFGVQLHPDPIKASTNNGVRWGPFPVMIVI